MSKASPGQRRKHLTPNVEEAWRSFSQSVLADGALDARTKQLIAVAVAHVTQCPDCIRGHVRGAVREQATEQQIMEAIWVAAEMRAGGAVAHSRRAFEAWDETQERRHAGGT